MSCAAAVQKVWKDNGSLFLSLLGLDLWGPVIKMGVGYFLFSERARALEQGGTQTSKRIEVRDSGRVERAVADKAKSDGARVPTRLLATGIGFLGRAKIEKRSME